MWDVLVVGSGAAGMMAALTAAEKGARCLVLEKGENIAVSNASRAGGPALAGAQAQRDENASVTADQLFEHMYRFSRGTVNAGLLRRAVDQGPAVDRIFRECGIGTRLLPDSYGVGFRARVAFTDKGKARWQPLADRLTQLGGTVLFGREVVGIQPAENGFIVSAGSGDAFEAKSVVIAAGGYLGSRSMLKEHFGDINVLPLGNQLSDGAGIRLAVGLGGTEDRNWGICANEFCGANHKIKGPQFTEETRFAVCGGLLVDRKGDRFMNEQLLSDQPLSLGGEALLRAGRIYAVTDDAMMKGLHENSLYEYYGSPEGWYAGRMNPDRLRGRASGVEKAVAEGWARQGSAAELAARLDMPALEETVDRYNEACREGRDSRFGKAAYLLRPLDHEHLTLFEYEPSAWCTFGGVKTDDHCRLLDAAQRVIPGVYAAGVDNGSCYCVPYYDNEGAALGLALTTGVIAGSHAADYVRTV